MSADQELDLPLRLRVRSFFFDASGSMTLEMGIVEVGASKVVGVSLDLGVSLHTCSCGFVGKDHSVELDLLFLEPIEESSLDG